MQKSNASIKDSALSSERQLLGRVCWLYYMESLTHKEIANRLGFSRVKVTRLLQQAREQGMVQINIDTEQPQFLQLEHTLCRTFGLQDAVVVMEAEQGPLLYRALANGAASWLSSRLKPDMLIGLSLGRTLSYLPEAFQNQMRFQSPEPIDCAFTELMGGASEEGRGFASYSTVSRMAELTGGQAHYIYAPTVVSSPELRKLLVQENAVSQALERARSCDIALQSVGALDDEALLYQSGYLTDTDMALMQEAGAIGNILNHFVDAQGQLIPNPLEERCIGLSLDDIGQIPLSVCIAGGPTKAGLIRASLESRLFNVLITDATTAQSILESARVTNRYPNGNSGH